MRHLASRRFWAAYELLPEPVRQLADRNYELLKRDPHLPSLHFKKVGRFWSVRVGLRYRALAVEQAGSFVWFWIGSHAEYDRLIGLSPSRLGITGRRHMRPHRSGWPGRARP